jgi:hypothetical protein
VLAAPRMSADPARSGAGGGRDAASLPAAPRSSCPLFNPCGWPLAAAAAAPPAPAPDVRLKPGCRLRRGRPRACAWFAKHSRLAPHELTRSGLTPRTKLWKAVMQFKGHVTIDCPCNPLRAQTLSCKYQHTSASVLRAPAKTWGLRCAPPHVLALPLARRLGRLKALSDTASPQPNKLHSESR